MTRLDGKIALVTGGTSGLGRATVCALAEAGAKVVFSGRNKAGAEETLARLDPAQTDVRFVRQDVTRERDWERVMSDVLEREGRLDVLVNNAGVSRLKPIEALTLDDLNFVVSVNVEGMFLGLKAAMDAMKAADGGSIVNISALPGVRGSPNATAYSFAKAGTTHMARAAALEGRQWKIRVNAVHPGVLFEHGDRPSPGAVRLFGEQGAKQFVKFNIETTPLGRLGHPRDIGSVVVFLASDASRHVSGTSFYVDGGRMAGEFIHHGITSQPRT